MIFFAYRFFQTELAALVAALLTAVAILACVFFLADFLRNIDESRDVFRFDERHSMTQIYCENRV